MTDETGPEGEEKFEALLAYLKEQRAFDFTGYKRPSLVRRVRRRMETVGIEDFEDYQDYLEVHTDEFTELFNTILINVTGFFRDADAWRHLETDVLPPLLQGTDGQPIRVWSAGCASGEEAYTAAMVLAEFLGVEEFKQRVKIYATDVDDEALAMARQATYTSTEVGSVPQTLREKYFETMGSRFVFHRELRRSVIFGRNDLVQDAPISHVDLLTCRNTLMYFNAAAQAQILQRLHFALRPKGVLFLGKAEMLLSHSGLFQPIDLKRRVFRKMAVEVRDRVAPLTLAANAVSGGEGQFDKVRYAALMSSAAAQLVLDVDGRLAMSNNRASHLFGLGLRDIGRPIQDLEVSYRPVELRAHIDEAVSTRRTVWLRDATLTRGDGHDLSLDIQFVPLTDEAGNPIGTTVIFNDVTQYRQLQHDLEYANRQLETAYEELQSTNEELETTNEELQSTVEELETTNEELQSTNEELETMNEELQSMNDELQAGNQALRERQDEVERLNDFMSAVLASMTTGVAVVDDNLRILAWNAKAEDLWGVRADEAVNAHLLSLDIGLPLEQLRPLLKHQLSDGAKQHDALTLDAVNRRGRNLQVEVTISRLARDGVSTLSGAIVVMDPIDS